jgi:hypothetical protein
VAAAKSVEKLGSDLPRSSGDENMAGCGCHACASKGTLKRGTKNTTALR